MNTEAINKLKTQLITSGNIYDIQKLNSFLHIAPKKMIRELYEEYKDTWIFKGTFTYYAEDLPKYEHSAKLENGSELFALGLIYNALFG